MNRRMILIAAFTALAFSGCGNTGPDCGPCPDSGCATLDTALDSWAWLIECCARMNVVENKPKWAARWTHVPPDWILACTGRQTCTDYGPGWTDCTDRNDPITWENEAAMDLCLLDQRTSDTAWCDGATLMMCGKNGTSSSVDCAGFCDDADATCRLDDGDQATCSCGFPFVEAF